MKRSNVVGQAFAPTKGGRVVNAETAEGENKKARHMEQQTYLHHLDQAAAAASSPAAANPSLPSMNSGDSLNLTTSIKLFSRFRPSTGSNERFYSVDEESSQRITTFELQSDVPKQQQEALSELLILVEDDQCDRFYLVDETLGTCAVVCGPQTAFWYGTTPSLRAKLKKRGVQYRATSATQREFEKMEDLLELGVSGKHAQECTLYFSTAMQVRGMIEVWQNTLGGAARRLRVLAASPFPHCTIKVCHAKLTLRPTSSNGEKQWVTTMEGAYFNSLEVDRFIQAFYRDNTTAGAADSVRVKMQTLTLTRDFDRACAELYVEGEEETLNF